MRRRLLTDRIVRFSLAATGLFSVLILAGIFILLFYNGMKAFKIISLSSFFLSIYWNPSAYGKSSYGVLQLLWSSVLVTIGSMVIAIPLGIGVAAYLAEIAPPWLRTVIKSVIEILAGIPSVAIGFVGVVLIGPAIAKIFHLSNGFNALNGSILLAFVALPTIISVSEDALSAVPSSFKEGSYALGGDRWITLVLVIIPAGLSGVIAGCILGFGRAIGETMTVLMVTGNATSMPHGIFDSVRTLTATIAIELGEVPYGSPHYYSLFVLGSLLFMISLVINFFAEQLAAKFRYKNI